MGVKCQDHDADYRAQGKEPSTTTSLGDGVGESTKVWAFNQVKVATQDFREENLLGEAAFGRVYRGQLNRQQVAIKVK